MTSISLTAAVTIAEHAVAFGVEHGYDPLTVAVLDPGGHPVVLHRQEADRQPHQVVRAVDALAVQQQRITGPQRVFGVAVAVDHHAFEHVQQLGARVLEAGEHLAGLGQRHQHRLEALVLPPQRAEQLVVVANPGAAAHDHRPAARGHVHRLPRAVGAAEQRGDRHVQTRGQPCHGGQAARGLRVLDLGQHRLGDADLGRHLGDREPRGAPQRPDLPGDRGLQVAAGGRLPDHLPLHGRGIAGVAVHPGGSRGLGHPPILTVVS